MADRATTQPTPVSPFLKWAGGKGGLLAQYEPFLPPRDEVTQYVEPFLGGGAVFFRRQYHPARLADINDAVINVYTMVRDRVEELLAALAEHLNDRDAFYRVRDQEPAALGEIERAARFIFLNRTCYNGLYRVNSQGRFNVPFGRYKNPRFCDPPGLRAASQALAGVELVQADFEHSTADCGPGDFVYFDPPYDPRSATASFTKYARDGFGADAQRRLAEVFAQLADRGVRVMLSNSDTQLIRELYDPQRFEVREIQARRAINSDPTRRGPVTELLILSRTGAG